MFIYKSGTLANDWCLSGIIWESIFQWDSCLAKDQWRQALLEGSWLDQSKAILLSASEKGPQGGRTVGCSVRLPIGKWMTESLKRNQGPLKAQSLTLTEGKEVSLMRSIQVLVFQKHLEVSLVLKIKGQIKNLTGTSALYYKGETDFLRLICHQWPQRKVWSNSSVATPTQIAGSMAPLARGFIQSCRGKCGILEAMKSTKQVTISIQQVDLLDE